jgi:hypothetical protein
MISLSDLDEYYRQFLAIMMYLRSKNRLSEAEQSRTFVRGFPPTLWSVILQRLQLKLPDHFPDDPYPLESIHEVARFTLHGTPASATTSTMSTQVVATSQASAPVEVKMEEFTTILERITESFVKALAAASTARASDRPPRPPQSGTRSNNCHFCNLPAIMVAIARPQQITLSRVNASVTSKDVLCYHQGHSFLATYQASALKSASTNGTIATPVRSLQGS